jgi:hypothetical protein
MGCLNDEKTNAFKATTTDMPGLMAAMLLEMATLKAEVRALGELVKNPVGRILGLTFGAGFRPAPFSLPWPDRG